MARIDGLIKEQCSFWSSRKPVSTYISNLDIHIKVVQGIFHSSC